MYNVDRQSSTERILASRDCNYAADIPLEWKMSLHSVATVSREPPSQRQ